MTSTLVWVADTGAIQASKDRVLGIFTSVRCRLVRLGMVEAIRQWQDNRRCYGMPKGVMACSERVSVLRFIQ